MTNNFSKKGSKNPLALGVWIILIWIFWASTRLVPWLPAALTALLLSVLLAAVTDKAASSVSRLIKLPKKLCAALIFFASATLLTISLFSLGELLVKEARELLVELSLYRTDADALVIKLTSEVSGILSAYLPFEVEAEHLSEALTAASDSLITYATSAVGKLAVGALSASPKIFFAAVTLLTACFYMATDYDTVRSALWALVPDKLKSSIPSFKADAVKVAKKCAVAYGLFYLMTAALVWIGLLIIGSPYALIMALAVATVDLLPVLGAGAVLLPWSALSFALGEPRFALGLIVIFGVVTAVRKIVEPKLLGAELGVHPLISLAFLVLGGALFGFLGVLLSPFAAYIFSEFIKKRAKSKKM